MISIHVDFAPFAEVHLGDLFGLTGVYVIWDDQAELGPSYIGEGIVLERFAHHSERGARRFKRPINGYVGFIDPVEDCDIKEAACAIECLLLEVAERTNRIPVANVHPGHRSLVKLLCEKGVVRVSVRGCDPLAPPTASPRIGRVKTIRVKEEAMGEFSLQHDWRRRRTA